VARCWWADLDDLLRHDHDTEWGRPMADDTRLFEMMMLESFQAGLSWLTVLRKRSNFRAAFRGFKPPVVARFTSRDLARLLNDAGIIRNRAKIEATINNARRMPELIDEFGSFAAYVWSYEPKRRPRPAGREDLPSQSEEATAMSKDLRKRGWMFVGPTTVYSFVQATGLVNDHVRGCAAGAACERARREFRRPK
jgi:DNA-3-methyladenine glycosylase I